MQFRGGAPSAGRSVRRKAEGTGTVLPRVAPESRKSWPGLENRPASQHEACPSQAWRRPLSRRRWRTRNPAGDARLRGPLHPATARTAGSARWKLHPGRRPAPRAATSRQRVSRQAVPGAGPACGPAPGSPSRVWRGSGRGAGSDRRKGVGIRVTSPGNGPPEAARCSPPRSLTPGGRRTYPAASLGVHPFGSGAAVGDRCQRNVPCIPVTQGIPFVGCALRWRWERTGCLHGLKRTPGHPYEGPNPA
jgi:hypothetical protein